MAIDHQKTPIGNLSSELSQATAGLVREELLAMAADLARQGRQVGVGAGLLGAAGVLGVGSFGAGTAALIAALGGRPARGAFLVAAIYGAGAGALADAGVKRLTGRTAEAGETSAVDADAAATRARKAPAKARKTAAEARKAPAEARKAPAEARKAPAKARKAPAKAPKTAAKAVKGKTPAKVTPRA